MTCPGLVLADPIPEPLPPPGFTEEDFVTALVKGLPNGAGGDTAGWLFGQWRPWAREMAARADKARTWCLEQMAKSKPKPP